MLQDSETAVRKCTMYLRAIKPKDNLVAFTLSQKLTHIKDSVDFNLQKYPNPGYGLTDEVDRFLKPPASSDTLSLAVPP